MSPSSDGGRKEQAPTMWSFARRGHHRQFDCASRAISHRGYRV